MYKNISLFSMGWQNMFKNNFIKYYLLRFFFVISNEILKKKKKKNLFAETNNHFILQAMG